MPLVRLQRPRVRCGTVCVSVWHELVDGASERLIIGASATARQRAGSAVTGFQLVLGSARRVRGYRS